MNQGLSRVIKGFLALGALGALGWTVATSTEFARAALQVDASVGGVQTHQGHFVNANYSDVPWSLSPALADSSPAAGEKLTIKMADKPYTPSNAEGLDDYHCFVVDPKLARDAFVTGVNIKPGNAKVVHHVILYRVEGAQVAVANAKNAQSGGEGWTCFGGPNLSNSLASAGGASWLGAWAPGAGSGAFPTGLGVPLKAGSLIVMQVHYNLANGAQPDLSSAELTLAPEGAKLTPLRTRLLYAPVELACATGTNTPQCNRDNAIQDNVKKFGMLGELIPRVLLSACKRDLETYQSAAGDASKITTNCDNPMPYDGTLYSIAGHMHLRGVDIRMELNPGTPAAKTLLHIPKWDFHWQGNYWFKTPVEVKKADVVRLSCTFDNSTDNQPILGDKPATPRYITWGEGTNDEMCLGLVTIVQKPQ
jgi:hypothetical protein